jgi:hypothetical protein
MKFLVIGGTGVAGSAAIEAVRRHFPAGSEITALWYAKQRTDIRINGADRAVFGDITDDASLEAIADVSGENFDYVFFATALGDVGFPITAATPEQIAAACRVSFDPMVRLERRFTVGAIAGYSTFYNLEHQRINYGAMGHAKERLERWVMEPETGLRRRRICIRAGAFESASSKAIKLMLQRRAKDLAASGDPILESFFNGRKPSEAVAMLESAIYDEERRVCGDTGTTRDNLVDAHVEMFRHPEARFVNVCGGRIWLSDDPQLIAS